MAEDKKRKDEEEIFDIFGIYPEGVEKRKSYETKHEIEHLDFRDIFREIKELIKKERKIAIVIGIEILLTVIFVLMLIGLLPLL